MTDDIVTRLRDDYSFVFKRFATSVPSLVIAADEIERLRETLAETQRQLEYWLGKVANP